MNKPMKSLYGTVGRPIVVIGGSPSTLDDLSQVPDDCYTIAVNHHCNGVIEPDLAVWSDKITPSLMEYGCENVGPRGADYLYDLPKLPECLSMSGYKAAMLALQMTDKEVYIAGMDCYSEEKTYFDGSPNSHTHTVELCTKGWTEIKRLHPNRLVFFSDVLKEA